VFAVSAAAVVGGCSLGGGGETGATPSCASAVRWNGDVYFGNDLRMPRAARVGTGVTPPCRSGDDPRRVALHRLRGVDPTVAVAVAGDDDTVFLAEGFLPQLASHPVHDAIERRSGPLLAPRRCSREFAESGTVTAVSPLLLRSRRGEAAISLHARTRVTGFLRAGQPYLQRGDRITVRGRVCAERTRFADRIGPWH
jgi:hypothetical protein